LIKSDKVIAHVCGSSRQFF